MSRIVTCPKCKFRFDISYSRLFACRGCPESYIDQYGMVKCPKCGYEFPKV